MQLNPVGLVGFFILLNLIQLVGFDFFSGCCFIVLNGNARGDSGPRLLRKNPLITFTHRQFKKEYFLKLLLFRSMLWTFLYTNRPRLSALRFSQQKIPGCHGPFEILLPRIIGHMFFCVTP